MSGQVQGSTGLMRVKEVDDVQAEVPLEPLDVRVCTVKDLITVEKVHSAESETQSAEDPPVRNQLISINII